MQSDRLRRTGRLHRRGGAASSESSAATATIAAAVSAAAATPLAAAWRCSRARSSRPIRPEPHQRRHARPLPPRAQPPRGVRRTPPPRAPPLHGGVHAPECGFSLGEREAASRRALARLAPPAHLPRSRRPGARPPAAPYAPRTSARAARRRLGTEGARAARWGSAGVGAGVQRLQLS